MVASAPPQVDTGQGSVPAVRAYAVGLMAILCALLGLALAAIWITYRHYLTLTEVAGARAEMTNPPAASVALVASILMTVALMPALLVLCITLYPVWRGSRGALLAASIGTGLLAVMAAMVSGALLLVRPFDVAGDGDPPASLTEEFERLDRLNPIPWFEWAMLLGLPAVALCAVPTLILMVVLLRMPRRY